MISKLAGIFSAKNTKTKFWWTKLAIALVLSNVFFFILFGGDNTSSAQTLPSIPVGHVEIQVEARLHTPFQKGKKVLLVNRSARKKISGVLNQSGSELDQRVTVLVPEKEAALLFQHENWEILPHLPSLQFQTIVQRESHEIRY